MLKVRFITWSGHVYARERLRHLFEYHRQNGDDVGYTHFSADDRDEQLQDCGLVYIWNGEYDHARRIRRELRKKGVHVVCCEIGWFPQAEYLYFDDRGTNGECSLHFDPLDWLESSDFEVMEKFGSAYREGRELSDEGYVFVPMQLPGDQQLHRWSPFKYMGSFVREVRQRFPDKKIIFRRHPKDPKSYEDLDLGEEGEGDLKDLICGASLIYGINSTVLLEASLMGKPVVAIGKSFLSIGPSRAHALTALVARQVPIDATDFSPWMRPGRGLTHLIE